MSREVVGVGVKLLNPFLLLLVVTVFDFIQGCGIDLLLFKIGWQLVLILFEVLFGLLDIEWTVHDLDLHLQTGLLLLEVAQCKPPLCSVIQLTNGVALLVEIVGD